MSAQTIELVLALVAAIFAGGFMTSVLTTITGGRKRKIDEAEALSRISTAIRDEVRKENADLRERMDRIAEAMIGLTDLLDEIFPKIVDSLHPEERTALRNKIKQAKKAG